MPGCFLLSYTSVWCCTVKCYPVGMTARSSIIRKVILKDKLTLLGKVENLERPRDRQRGNWVFTCLVMHVTILSLSSFRFFHRVVHMSVV